MLNIPCELGVNEKNKIVACLRDGIGDDVIACLRREKIKERKSNGKKLLKWDFVNRNLIDNFKSSRLSAEYARRGAWFMVPLYDKEHGYIYTVMREDRFSELRKNQSKRKKAHYLDAFVQAFNFDLDVNKQMNLFNMQQFSTEEVEKIVNDILEDFKIESRLIRRHAVILFEEYNSEVTAVRCCLLDSSLQIVAEEDWSRLIANDESVVVETANADDKTMPKLTLKSKAREKIGQRELVAMKKENEEQEKIEKI